MRSNFERFQLVLSPFKPNSKSILDLSKTIEWVQKIKEDKIHRYVPGFVTITGSMSFAIFNPTGTGKINSFGNIKPMIESTVVGIWKNYDDFTSFLH